MEQKLAAGLGEWEITKLVEHDEVETGQVIGEPALPSGTSFALQSIDEVDDGIKAASRTAADAGSRDGNSEMAFTGAGATNQHGVALLTEKGAASQVADQRLVDRRAGEVEVVDVLGQRQLGDGQLVLDRARLFLGNLGAEQIADDARRVVAAPDPGCHHLVIGGAHAVELERRHQLENVSAFHQDALRRLSYRAQSAIGRYCSRSASGIRIVGAGLGSRRRARMLRTTSAEWTPPASASAHAASTAARPSVSTADKPGPSGGRRRPSPSACVGPAPGWLAAASP